MSTHCEDYPACGHEPVDCPDRMKCVGCGKILPKDALSSICGQGVYCYKTQCTKPQRCICIFCRPLPAQVVGIQPAKEIL